MDDWPRTLYTTSWGSFLFRKSVLNKLKKASQRSLQSFAISEALAEKYANVLGVKMLPLMNPASRIANGINAHQDEMVRFVYAGSIGLNRWKSLLDIAQVLETEAKKGHQISLTSMFPQATSQKKWMRRLKSITQLSIHTWSKASLSKYTTEATLWFLPKALTKMSQYLPDIPYLLRYRNIWELEMRFLHIYQLNRTPARIYVTEGPA